MTSHAAAERSAYCARVEARSRSDAALLFSPRILVSALRNPSTLDVGPTLADRLQLRVGASLSLVDIWRGARILAIGRADCTLHGTEAPLRRTVTSPMDALLVDAHRALLRAVEARAEEREALVARGAERLKQNLITVIEFHELQQLSDELRKKQNAAASTLARLHAEGFERPPSDLSELVRGYERASEHLEQRVSAARNLEPFTLRVTGGAIPSAGAAADWYGWVEFSYNLGGLARLRHERSYRDARKAELAREDHELPVRLHALQTELGVRVDQARGDAQAGGRQLAFIASTLRSLGASELPNVAHARDGLVLQHMLAESEHAFNTALVESLSPLRSDAHGQ